MQTEDNPNQIPLERAHPVALVDPFDECMKILSEIPTDRSMKELSKIGAPIPATRQAIETMALWKETIIKSLRLMRIREQALQMDSQIKYDSMGQIDKTMADYIKLNPNFKIVLESD